MNLQPQSDLNFVKATSSKIRSNKLVKFIVLGGAACSAFNAFIGEHLGTGLFEALGVATASWIASQSLKGGQNMSMMSDSQVNKHLAKGAFLTIGGAVLAGVANVLPGPLAHMAHYPTSILVASGVMAVGEAGIQKFKRPKI